MTTKHTSRRNKVLRHSIESLEARSLFAASSLVAAMPQTQANINAVMDDVVVAGGHTFFTSGRSDRGEALFVAPPAGSSAPPMQLLETETFFREEDKTVGVTAEMAFHDKLYFLANGLAGDGLYSSDGSVAGTVLVKQLRAVHDTGSLPANMFALNGSLYFFWTEGSNAQRLYRTDGTTDGTSIVWTTPTNAYLTYLTTVDGRVFFTTRNAIYAMSPGDQSPQLFVNGFGPDQGATESIVRAGNALFYLSDSYSPSTARSLYASDLDGSNVRLAFAENSSGSGLPSYVGPTIAAVGNRVVFTSRHPQGSWPRLFSSAGTVASQLQIAGAIGDSSAIGEPTAINGTTATFAHGSSLATTDGTVAGTQYVSFSLSTALREALFRIDGTVFYRLASEGGLRLLKTDGTAAGTRILQYAFPNAAGYQYYYRGIVDGRPVFDDILNTGHHQLWSIDPNAQTGTISGAAFTDLSRDGIRQLFEPLIFGIAYVDSNGNGIYDTSELRVESPTFTFDNLVEGTYPIRFQPSNSTATPAPIAPITLSGGQTIQNTHFIAAATSTVVWGQVFGDLNANGVRDPEDLLASGQAMYLDLDGNGVWSGSTTTEPLSYTAYDGTYGFSNVSVSNAVVRRVDLAGYVQTSPANRGARTVTAIPGASTKIADFGVAQAAAGIVTGVVWLDRNSNRKLDGADTPIGGSVFADYNGDGIRQSTEPSANISSSLTFQLTLPAERYRIGVVPSSTYGAYTVSSVGGTDVQVVSGVTTAIAPLLVTVANVGTLPTGKIDGGLYIDRNANGSRDAADAPASGVLVFLDTDNDNVLDPTERRTYTDASGNYAFPYTPAATYRVRVQLPAAWSFAGTGLPGTTVVSTAQPTVTLADVGLVSSDTNAPTLLDWRYDSIQRRFSLTFSEEVSATLAIETLKLAKVSTGALVSLPAGTVIDAQADSTTATITLGASLGAGVFTLQLQGVTDRSGNVLAAPSLEFGTFAGDINGDGTVNFDDLIVLAQNYGRTGLTFSQGNLDYNAGGSVNFDDLIILAQHYGQTMAPVVAPSLAKSPAAVKRDRVAVDVLG